MYKCQIYSSSFLRYTPLNQSAHVIDTLFTHDTTWRHLWRHYFCHFCDENKSWYFLNLRWTGFTVILLSHQQKVQFFWPTLHVYWLWHVDEDSRHSWTVSSCCVTLRQIRTIRNKIRNKRRSVQSASQFCCLSLLRWFCRDWTMAALLTLVSLGAPWIDYSPCSV